MKQYLTVKEFAEAAAISQQAVYKQLEGRLKPYVKVVGRQKMIHAAAIEKFYKHSTQIEQVEQPDSTAEIQENSDSCSKVEQPIQSTDSTNEIQRLLSDQVADLRKQLQEKQEEIEFLRDEVREKGKLIESLTDNLKISQQLAAADKKQLLELKEKQAEPEPQPTVVEQPDQPEEPEVKRKWWQRIFGI